MVGHNWGCFGRALILASAFGPLVAGGSVSAPTSHETWPELQIVFGLDEATDLALLVNATRERDEGTTTEIETGFSLTHRFDQTLSLGIGYRYKYAPGDDPYREHLVLAEQTIRFEIVPGWKVGLRTREDFRWLDEGFSVRFRERAKIEREFSISGYAFTPYATAELFYDTRFDRISRGELIFGVVLPITERLSMDISGVRRINWHPHTSHVNAIGLSIAIQF